MFLSSRFVPAGFAHADDKDQSKWDVSFLLSEAFSGKNKTPLSRRYVAGLGFGAMSKTDVRGFKYSLYFVIYVENDRKPLKGIKVNFKGSQSQQATIRKFCSGTWHQMRKCFLLLPRWACGGKTSLAHRDSADSKCG